MCLQIPPASRKISVHGGTFLYGNQIYESILHNHTLIERAERAEKAFPNATIVIDCFHIIKRTRDATEEIRLRKKRLAITEQNKERADFKKKQERNRKQRKYYRKRHPKKYKGKKRGRKPIRGNSAFRPTTLDNGETKVELITKSKHLLSMSRDKWSDSQKTRAALLFGLYPKIKEAYELVDSLRAVFRSKLSREEATKRLHGWYQKVAECTMREVKAARDLIKSREEQVLNYFINRSTNAAAESLNFKIEEIQGEATWSVRLHFLLVSCESYLWLACHGHLPMRLNLSG